MSHPFTHPKGRALLKRVAQAFRDNRTYILGDSNIAFVCGGPINRPGMRSRFCEYAKVELPQFRVFLAEKALEDFVKHEEPEFHNLVEFEEVIAEVSACVIIFLESEGSFSELGFFASQKAIRKKLLVVNDVNLQSEDSFIALGPINLIDRNSLFRPTIQMSFGDDPPFHFVKERLEKRTKGKNKRKFKFTKYRDMETRERFFAILEIIKLFQAMTYEGVEYAFRSIFKNVNKGQTKILLAILVAADYVRRSGDALEYFTIDRDKPSFMEFNSLDIGKFRLEVLDFYEQHFTDVHNIVKGLSE